MFNITKVQISLLTVSGKIVDRIVEVKCSDTRVAQNIVRKKYAKKLAEIVDMKLV